MNVNTLLETLPRECKTYCDAEELALEFGIHCYTPSFLYEEDCKLKGYDHPDVCWVCTDTGVGISFFFLDDQFVFITMQSARKDDEYFYWKDRASYDMVKRWFIEQKNLTDGAPEPSLIDFDADLSQWHQQKLFNDDYNKKQLEKYRATLKP